MQKLQAEAVCADLSRWILIARLGRSGTRLLILGADLRSNDRGRLGAWAAEYRAGGSVLRWRGLQLAGDGEKGSAGLDLLGFESGMTRVERVIHLWHRRGSGRLGGMDTAAVAVLQVVAAGEQRSARQGGLSVLFTSTKGRAGRCDAHRVPVSSREDLQGGRRRGPAASRGGARGKSLQRRDPGVWAPLTGAR